MTKSHARKSKARQRQSKTGARYTSANANTTHRHRGPNLAPPIGLSLPGATRDHLRNATNLVGACWDRCFPCQRTLVPKVVEGPPLALTLVAYYVYAGNEDVGVLASPATLTFARAATAARIAEDLASALEAVRAMNRSQRSALLEDALDMWTGAHAMHIAPRAGRPNPPSPKVGHGNSPTPDGVFLDTSSIAPPGAAYNVVPGVGGAGAEVPLLLLAPTGPRAGLEDLSIRCGWTRELATDVRPVWLLHVDEALGCLHSIVRLGTDADGVRPEHWSDDIVDMVLWFAEDVRPLPASYVNLLKSTDLVLMLGPAANPSELMEGEAAGGLVCAAARIVFSTHPTRPREAQ